MGIAERWARTRPLPDDIHQRLDALHTFLQRENVRLAYLFGSLAAGASGHDVDLALLMPEGRPAYPLRQPLNDLLDTQRLDLVDLNKASPTLRFEIIRSGRLLYKVDDDTENDFEMATLRTYHDREIPRRRQWRHLRERMQQWSSAQNRSARDSKS